MTVSTMTNSNENKKAVLNPAFADKCMEKYSLRLRKQRVSSVLGGPCRKNTKCRDTVKEKPKTRAPPLSKYRRKTANARERIRMQEINSAFETLRRCVPAVLREDYEHPANEKLTKITTLRLAMEYIRTLKTALSDSSYDPAFLQSDLDGEPQCSTSMSRDSLAAFADDLAMDLEADCPDRGGPVRRKNSTKSESYLKETQTYTRQTISSDCLSSPVCSGYSTGSQISDATDDEEAGLQLVSDDEFLKSPEMPSLFSCKEHKPFELSTKRNMDLELPCDSAISSPHHFEVEPCISPFQIFDTSHPFDGILSTAFPDLT